MKKAVLAVAVVLAGLGFYFRYQNRIQKGVDAVKEDFSQTGSPTATVVDVLKGVVSGDSSGPADESIPLAPVGSLERLPESLAVLSGESKLDLVIEVTGGAGALPARLRVADNIWLDLSSLVTGASIGTKVLVHVNSAGPVGADVGAFVAGGTAEPAPQSLSDALARSRWRSELAVPAASGTAPQNAPYQWATAFQSRADRNDLHGPAIVEGTFGAYKRATGNATYNAVMLEEAPRVQFYFGRGSQWESIVSQAEQRKKRGQKVTLRMIIGLDDNPKYMVQDIGWGIPLKEKFEYWRSTIGARASLLDTLALAAWAESRDLSSEAKSVYAAAHALVSPESAAKLGTPFKAIRVHAQDGVQDHWFFDTVTPVTEAGHYVDWGGEKVPEVFYSVPNPVCIWFQTDKLGRSSGDYFLLTP